MNIVDFYYNGNNGIAKTIIEIDGTQYSGKAKCHPDDEKYKSENIGRDLSYMRAVASAQKADLRARNKEIKLLEDFVKSLECYKNFNKLENDESAKAVYRQLNRRRREVELAAFDLRATNWIISEICTKGSKLDDVLLRLESAIDKGVI